jgi:hypothetical protein
MRSAKKKRIILNPSKDEPSGNRTRIHFPRGLHD